MDIAGQIKCIRKEKRLSQQEIADKLSLNRAQYNRIETGKSNPYPENVALHIANALDMNIIKFFETKNNGTEIHTVNEPLSLKVHLQEELVEVQENSICNKIGTAIPNKRPKQTLNNAMSLTIKKI